MAACGLLLVGCEHAGELLVAAKLSLLGPRELSDIGVKLSEMHQKCLLLLDKVINVLIVLSEDSFLLVWRRDVDVLEIVGKNSVSG